MATGQSNREGRLTLSHTGDKWLVHAVSRAIRRAARDRPSALYGSFDKDPASRLHYKLNHASAARCNYEYKCNKYSGLKYPLTEKMRDTTKKCEFCHMAKGRHRPTC